MSDKDNERREYPRVNKIERREYQRVVVRLETDVSSDQKYQVSGWTKDLSVKGVFVICAQVLPIGAFCQCRMSLGDVLKGSPYIMTEGRVVRCDKDGIAVQFAPQAVECFKRFREHFQDIPA